MSLRRYVLFIFLVVLSTTSLYAQRTADFRRLSLENGLAAQKSWLISDQSSLGIDENGTLTGTFPNTNAMLTLGAGTKGNALDIQSLVGGTGILFSQNIPSVGIDMLLGASGTGIIIDGGTPVGITIGNATAGSDGMTVDATNSGISIGNGTAPNNGMNIEATSTGLSIGAATTPDIGQTTEANITGGTFDAGIIGVDIGQSSNPSLGLGVSNAFQGIDVQNSFIGIGINNVFGGLSVTNSLFSIQTDAEQTFGDGGGSDNTTLNIGGGNFTINTLPSPFPIPAPFENVTYMNGSNQMNMTPIGVNVITGSGTLNTIAMWTPNGFTLGNSIITETPETGVAVNPTAGTTDRVFVVNGVADATILSTAANTVWDSRIIGDQLVTGLVKVGGSIWLDGTSATHSIVTNAPTNVGTTNNNTMSIIVNNTRAMMYVPTIGGANIIGGEATNSIVAGGYSNIIAGGGALTFANSMTNPAGTYNTISGGGANVISGAGSTGTIGGGGYNQVTAFRATVAGGAGNTASGQGAFVGGGESGIALGANNTASGAQSVIGGGQTNTASGSHSTIGGGQSNLIIGSGSTIAGGNVNQINSTNTINTIGGGSGNQINGTVQQGTIAGGGLNIINGASKTWGVIGGGSSNTVISDAGTVAGGRENNATDDYSTVGGGQNNRAGDNAGTTADRSHATVGGGQNNTASGIASTVGGGRLNSVQGNYSTASGGSYNQVLFQNSFVGGGRGNQNFGIGSVIVGGDGGSDAYGSNNKINAPEAFIGGGFRNENYGDFSVIVGGEQNFIASNAFDGAGHNIIVGGQFNQAGGDNTGGAILSGMNFVGGGHNNRAYGGIALNQSTGMNAVICGDQNWVTGGTGQFSGLNFIGGGYINTITGGSGNLAGGNFIGGGYFNDANGTATLASGANVVAGGWDNNAIPAPGTIGKISMGGGQFNNATGSMSTIAGGNQGTASGAGSVISGGGYDGTTFDGNATTGNASVVAGGIGNTASGNYASVTGGRNAVATHYGENAHASGSFAADGDAQSFTVVMRNESAGAAVVNLFLDGAASLLTIPDNTSWNAEISISGRGNTGVLVGSANFIVSIVRGVGAGTTALQGPVTTLHNQFNFGGAAMTITADNVNGALNITCANVIPFDPNTRWVATVRVTQVTF